MEDRDILIRLARKCHDTYVLERDRVKESFIIIENELYKKFY